MSITTGFLNPGEGYDTGVGIDGSNASFLSWIDDPEGDFHYSNILEPDGTYALELCSSLNGNAIGSYFGCRTFNFNLPSSAKIKGFEVKLISSGWILDTGSADSVDIANIKFIKNTNLVGDSIGSVLAMTPSAPTDYDFGSETNLGNTTWTVDDVNNSNFGVGIQFRYNNGVGADIFALMDNVQMQVNYDLAFEPSGLNLSLSGSSQVSLFLPYLANGSITLNGSSNLKVYFTYIVNGSLNIYSSTFYEQRFYHISVGHIVLSGNLPNLPTVPNFMDSNEDVPEIEVIGELAFTPYYPNNVKSKDKTGKLTKIYSESANKNNISKRGIAIVPSITLKQLNVVKLKDYNPNSSQKQFVISD